VSLNPVRFVVKAPATTANLGPGFDCAGAALDLWNELHVAPAESGEPLVTLEGEGSDEIPQDETHLALRAFALAAPLTGHRFHFVNRIPLERGLGSSSATVAAGLVAGLAVAGRDTSLEEVLELGLPLEGHADNLAPALAGGVCLIWKGGGHHRVERIATDMPLASILLIPEARVNTRESRSRLPEFVRHDVAAAAAAQTALLGAAIAAGNADLLAAAFHDVLHEPYRTQDAPLLEELRARPAEGMAGVTLSGSGPSVVAWARREAVASVAAELESRLADVRVLPLAIASRGTYAEDESPEAAIEVAARLGATA
jgi:homoserine kinase